MAYDQDVVVLTASHSTYTTTVLVVHTLEAG